MSEFEIKQPESAKYKTYQRVPEMQLGVERPKDGVLGQEALDMADQEAQEPKKLNALRAAIKAARGVSAVASGKLHSLHKVFDRDW